MLGNPNCTRCGLHNGVQSVCIWGSGAQQADILLVGEAPGAEEDASGKPFIGQAGRVLDHALAQAGLDRESVYVTNVAKCRPPSNRTPTVGEARACFPYLANEIEMVRPKVVVALGGAAIKLLSGRESVTHARGAILNPSKYVRLGDAKLIGTYHPAAYLNSKRNPMMLQGLIEDLAFAKRLAAPRDDEHQPPNEATFLVPGFTTEMLHAALAELSPAPTLAMDCEWTYVPKTVRRFSWPWSKDTELYSISLSGRVGNVVKSVGIACPLPEEHRVILANFLRGRRIIFHNAIADLIWLNHLKLPITLSGDTMLLAHLFNEMQPLSLATLAEVYCGIENWKQPLWSQRPISDEAWTKLLEYNVTDTWVTLLLMNKLEEKFHSLDDDEQLSIRRHYQHFMLPATILFVRMALRGMPLSQKAVDEAIVTESEKLEMYGKQLGEMTNRKWEEAIKLASSPLQVKELLRGTYGLDVDTTDGYVMEELAEQYDICNVIQNIKHIQKMLGTYLVPWSELLQEQGDGRLHSVYSITGTVTGRTSAQTEKGASIQLVPREVEGDVSLRKVFQAPPGFRLDSADYSQLEMRMAALIAGEGTLLDLLNNGDDPHKRMAAVIAGVPESQVTKEQRQNAKPVNFGFLYGMGAEKFQKQAKKDYKVDFTIEECERARKAFFTLYTDFPRWYKRCEGQFYKGYVRTLFGRYRRNLADPNKVPNTEVQTPSTELCMLTLIEVDRYLVAHPELESELVGFVHDSGVILMPDDERTETIHTVISDIMTRPPVEKFGLEKLGVPLEVEIKPW